MCAKEDVSQQEGFSAPPGFEAKAHKQGIIIYKTSLFRISDFVHVFSDIGKSHLGHQILERSI
ncbi:hypothetical protein L0222_27340, partial [bacterium]|nr:hypothetical protein [bacterium]